MLVLRALKGEDTPAEATDRGELIAGEFKRCREGLGE